MLQHFSCAQNFFCLTMLEFVEHYCLKLLEFPIDWTNPWLSSKTVPIDQGRYHSRREMLRELSLAGRQKNVPSKDVHASNPWDLWIYYIKWQKEQIRWRYNLRWRDYPGVMFKSWWILPSLQAIVKEGYDDWGTRGIHTARAQPVVTDCSVEGKLWQT